MTSLTCKASKVPFNNNNNNNNNSEIKRSQLHLGELQSETAPFPLIPGYTLLNMIDFSVKTVQVGINTGLVPPCTFEHHCTMVRCIIVVLVWSTEIHSEVVPQ